MGKLRNLHGLGHFDWANHCDTDTVTTLSNRFRVYVPASHCDPARLCTAPRTVSQRNQQSSENCCFQSGWRPASPLEIFQVL